MEVKVLRELTFSARNSVRLPASSHKVPCPPSVFVNGAIPAGGKILHMMMARYFRVIKRVAKTYSFKRSLLSSGDIFRRRNAGHFIKSGDNVSDMSELASQSTYLFDPLGPQDDHGITCAAQMR